MPRALLTPFWGPWHYHGITAFWSEVDELETGRYRRPKRRKKTVGDSKTAPDSRVGMILCFLLVSCALVLFVIAWCLLYCPEAVIHL